MTLQLLRQRDVIGRINVSPRELEQFMARQQNAPDQNAEYNISHILISVPVTASPEQIEAREAARARGLRQGEGRRRFRAARRRVLREQHRTSKAVRSAGAAARSCRRSSRTALPKMKAGEVSEPIRTPSGFHLFRLNDMRGGVQQAVVAQVHARHILLRTNELEDDQTIEQKLDGIRDRILNGGEDFAAIAAVTSQDPGSAADGGDLGWAGPGSFVPEFEQQLAGPAGERDHQAVQDAVRLAHRAAARPARPRRDRRRAHAARLRAAARSQSRRRNRAVAASPARRSLRGIQDVMPPPRLILTSGEPAGIGPDLCIDVASRAWPCDLVVAGDTQVLQSRAQQLRQISHAPALLARRCSPRRIARARCVFCTFPSRRQFDPASSIAPTRVTC